MRHEYSMTFHQIFGNHEKNVSDFETITYLNTRIIEYLGSLVVGIQKLWVRIYAYFNLLLYLFLIYLFAFLDFVHK